MNERIDWSEDEVKIIVNDYFRMFISEYNLQPYKKSLHRRSIMGKLNNRSEGSVEFKHQNISAALINMGYPYVKGYKPRYRYQRQLMERVIADYIENNKQELEFLFNRFAERSALNNDQSIASYEGTVVDPPKESILEEREPLYQPIKTNYLEREQNNRKLGEQGEKFVLGYEKWRLIVLGKENLADKIEWVAKDLGDGLGYDILSRNENGTDRYIEVKTTKLPIETPIFLTKNELAFSAKTHQDFYLYRVFDFDTRPQLFIKNGLYSNFCRLIPQTFKGYF